MKLQTLRRDSHERQIAVLIKQNKFAVGVEKAGSPFDFSSALFWHVVEGLDRRSNFGAHRSPREAFNQ